MKKMMYLLIALFALLLPAACGNADESTDPVDPPVDGTTFTLSFVPNNSRIVYAAWVEDADGNFLKPLYVCNSIVNDRDGNFNGNGYLTGKPLPYFRTRNGWTSSASDWGYNESLYSVDGVTGASAIDSSGVNSAKTVDLGSATSFRVCFDIDRSTNNNDYFIDRPAFTYKTELIQAGSASASYILTLDGWMGNGTTGDPYGQDPRQTVTGYEVYKYMEGPTALPFIADSGSGAYDNLVSSLSVTVE